MQNGVLMQFFHYRYPSGGRLWKQIKAKAAELADRGITAIWFPPPYKGNSGGFDVGYGVYDLFDLGEFNQKNTIPTKYGTRAELEDAISAVKNAGMQVYVDTVFNHKVGGDNTETVRACEVDRNNRNRTYGCRDIRIWSHFTFPGRRDADGNLKYSTMEWRWWHFDSADWDDLRQENKIYRLKDKTFEMAVSKEYGNYDYLLGIDSDTRHPEVDGELRWWGRWIVDTLDIDGFRIDAVKHIRSEYFKDWLNHLRTHFSDRDLFAVGEYWSGDIDNLHGYLTRTEGTLSLFDVPLHYRFYTASHSGSSYDMRTILDRTLMQEQPSLAVTFVDNHDTQPGEMLESWVEPWFKPLAYAIILLRNEGFPCIFYGDYFGDTYERHDGSTATMYAHSFLIDKFLFARHNYGFGDLHDYFDHPNTIGWTRLGNSEHPGSMAVVLSNGGDGYKWMNMFRPQAEYFDITEHFSETDTVTTNAEGWGKFPCLGGKVSVWLQK
ncbi:MAG: alpha-amylase [Cyanobacteria bacterium P01_F01_bin.33]